MFPNNPANVRNKKIPYRSPGRMYAVESYIRQEKSVCIASYGNKLSSLRNETLLFDLLTEVKLKLTLSEGV